MEYWRGWKSPGYCQRSRKFSGLQLLMFLNQGEEFLCVLYDENLLQMQAVMESFLFYYSMSDALSLDNVSNYYCPVAEIKSMVQRKVIKLISPLYNKCFTEVECECLSEFILLVKLCGYRDFTLKLERW